MEKIEKKDFDALVKQVNISLLTLSPQKKSYIKKIQDALWSTLQWIQSMNIFWSSPNTRHKSPYPFLNAADLTSSQIDAVCLASDLLRAFEKTQKLFDQEKIDKDPELIRQIEHQMEVNKQFFLGIYNMHKASFYANKQLW